VSSHLEAHAADSTSNVDVEIMANSDSPEMARFNDALRQAMRVSKADLKRLLAEDKVTPLVPQKRGRKPKASAHVSGGTD
jgi:acylphosphatase